MFGTATVVLMAVGLWPAGIASFCVSALTPLLDVTLKKSFEKVVEIEAEKLQHYEQTQDEIDVMYHVSGMYRCMILIADKDEVRSFSTLIGETLNRNKN